MAIRPRKRRAARAAARKPSVEQQFLSNTWIEISEAAYKHNLAIFQKLLGKKVELSVVIKANAYGHGWQSIARLAAKYGAHSFCVHSLDEALRLRRAGFNRHILILGHVPLSRLEEVVRESFRLAVFNRETLIKLDEISNRLAQLTPIHLKLETGTYRHGIDIKELQWYARKLKETPRVMLEAVHTHFADIEDTTRHDYAEFQRYCFKKMISILQESGFPILKTHAACSAAVLLFPDTHYDMVRLGISQFGLWPSDETLQAYQALRKTRTVPDLQPVLSWKTRISQLKWVAPENTIGYGRSFKTTRKTRLAVLPVGYADGYDRRLSNQGYVLVGGQRAPVRGRICMNLMMVDVTDIADVRLEDEVVLIGQQGKERITAGELAANCGTIHYEVLSRLNGEIPRMIV